MYKHHKEILSFLSFSTKRVTNHSQLSHTAITISRLCNITGQPEHYEECIVFEEPRMNGYTPNSYYTISKSWFVRHETKKSKIRHRHYGLPAIEWPYGSGTSREWWVNGKKHRINNLPAIMLLHTNEWWKNGIYIKRCNP